MGLQSIFLNIFFTNTNMYITKIGPGFVNYKKGCSKLAAATITADRNLFTESTCDPSITEYFQARWWCRPGMFLEQKSIKGLSNGIDKKMNHYQM
jgi:hypothetical protein